MLVCKHAEKVGGYNTREEWNRPYLLHEPGSLRVHRIVGCDEMIELRECASMQLMMQTSIFTIQDPLPSPQNDNALFSVTPLMFFFPFNSCPTLSYYHTYSVYI